MVKTVSKQCQNGDIPDTECQRLQQNTELHQKDLRILLVFMHILGPENEAVLQADMFLALSLIVRFYTWEGAITARRLDIQYPRPCQITDLCQNVRNMVN